MSKIQLTDNGMDVMFKMSEGNPGALTALMEIFKDCEAIDPDSALGAMGSVLLLDNWNIYGTDIYVLWSDVCERSTVKMLAVIRACQLGLFSSDILKDAAHRQDYSGKKLIPVDELYNKVKEKLPRFDSMPKDQTDERSVARM